MATLSDIKTTLAHYDGLNKKQGGRPRYLFRGQTYLYKTLPPLLARLGDNEARKQAHIVCRSSRLLGQAIGGYSIPRQEDGLAILQHYEWPTPLIDFTATPDVAVFFAHLKWKQGDNAVVFVIDCDLLSPELLVIEHDFFVLPLGDGGIQHRWVRQDGFAITITNWREFQAVLSFDLLATPFKRCVIETMQFQFPNDYAPPAFDLLSEHHDPVPRRIQNILRLYVDQMQIVLNASLKERLDGIYKGKPQALNLTFPELLEFVHGLPRWHKIAFVINSGRMCLRLFPITNPVDESMVSILKTAILYGEAACRGACSQPQGFSTSDISASDDAEKALKGSGLKYHIARSIACAAGISHVHVWDTSADCGLDVSMRSAIDAIKSALATGIITSQEHQNIEKQLFAAVAKLHGHAYSVHWADCPVDLVTLLA